MSDTDGIGAMRQRREQRSRRTPPPPRHPSSADSRSALPGPASGPGTVPVEAVAPNPFNDREQVGDVQDLAASMSATGLLQPCVVVTLDAWTKLYPGRADDFGDEVYVAVAGHRRLAAAKLAERSSVDVVVRDELASSVETLRVAALEENLKREPLDSLEEADAVAALVDICGSQVAAAHQLGYTQGWVSQRLTLRGLCPELRDELRAGNLTIAAARKLARQPAEEQVAAWKGEQDAGVLRGNSADDGGRAAAERAIQSLTRTLAQLDEGVRTDAVASVVREQLSAEERRRLLSLLAADAEPT